MEGEENEVQPRVEASTPEPGASAEDDVHLPEPEAPAEDSRPEAEFGGYDFFGDEDESNLPQWMQEYTEFERETGRKISVAPELIDQLPEDARRVVYNLQKGFTRKTQAVAEQRKELADKARELAQIERRVRSEQENLGKRMLAARDAMLEQLGNMPEPADPYSQEAIEYRAAQNAAKLIAENLFGPMQQQMQQAQEEVARSEEERAREARKDEIRSFIAEHDDFEDYRPDILELRKQYPTVRVEDLYVLARNRRPPKQADAPAPSPRRATREVVSRRPPTGARAGTARYEVPPEIAGDMKATYEWLQRQVTKR